MVEAKLSESRSSAREELETLYGPLVDWIYPDRQVILVEAYRYCRGEASEHIIPLVVAPRRYAKLHFL